MLYVTETMLWHGYQGFGQEVLQGFVKYVADTTESYFDQFEQVGFQLCFF